MNLLDYIRVFEVILVCIMLPLAGAIWRLYKKIEDNEQRSVQVAKTLAKHLNGCETAQKSHTRVHTEMVEAIHKLEIQLAKVETKLHIAPCIDDH